MADRLDFTGKAVVVTGGSGGIGAGIARGFAVAGANVVLGYHRSGEAAEQVVEGLRAAGGEALAVRADVRGVAGAECLIAACVEAFGGLDVLVNNAGAYPMTALLDMTEEEWDDILDVNLRSTFACTQAAARRMVEAGTGGAIVNIASIEAENPAPMHAHYGAAKAGVVMLTRCSAAELGRHGVRVNCVSPGLIWRAGIEEAWPEGVQRWQAAAPLARLGQPQDVADACLFLASDAAGWISGAELKVDGGVMTHQIF